MKKYAIIVAAGTGNRMQSSVPKQFLVLGKALVLMHSIEKFHQIGAQIIVTLAADYVDFWQGQCEKYQFHIPHQVVLGGTERFHSIQNALQQISQPDSLIAVHDAARPNVSLALLQHLYSTAQQFGNAIPTTPLSDSIRYLKANIALHRQDYCAVQTPQIFKYEQLMPAYLQPFQPQFTDDASVVEALQIPIHLTKGERSNIKITYPEDLAMLEIFFR